MDTLGSAVLVAVADESRRRSYREWLEAEFNVWTAADRLDVYEKVGTSVDVVIADRQLLERDGLGPGTFRDATDGCRVVLAGSDPAAIDADLTMRDPTPERLAGRTEQLLIEISCERLLAELATVAERKARLERDLDATARNTAEGYRLASERYDELDRRLDALVKRAEFDWAALFDSGAVDDDAGERAVGPAAE